MQLQFPITRASSEDLLWSLSRTFNSEKPNLILDISALPRELAAYMLDILIANHEHKKFAALFESIYVVVTSPKRLSDRRSIAPFSVGNPRFLYKDLQLERDKTRTTALIFPGSEGFEAQSVVDSLIGAESDIFVALDHECFSFPNALSTAVSNQTLINSWLQEELKIRHYFNPEDILRIGDEIIEHAIDKAKKYPDDRHQLLVAPFGAKINLLMGASIRANYLKRVDAASVDTDVIILPHFQYVSLYSRGSKISRLFKLGYETT
ncbi:hypothetical protein [Pseudoalteromonas maricaloris]|uniref:hypothetical protein n=1 Tax=Pseudoalteromonas maricaloris TaxID=184924 RepID=UPI003C287CFD